MPKELLYIPPFPRGSFTNASQNNIPDGFAAYTENVDPKFTSHVPARKSTALANAAALDAEVLRCTNFDGVKVWGWKSGSPGSIRAYDVATDALISAINTPSGSELAFMSNIERAIYLPFHSASTKEATEAGWLGLIGHGQFNTAAAGSTYVLENAKCEPYYDNSNGLIKDAACSFGYNSVTPASSYVVNSSTGNIFAAIYPEVFSNPSEDGFFSRGTTYYYAVSFVYDGFQESPLLKHAIIDNVSAGTSSRAFFSISPNLLTNNQSTLSGRIYISLGASGFSKRITGINLYRAETPGFDLFTGPVSKYRLVKTFSIRNGALSNEVVQIPAGTAVNLTNLRFWRDGARNTYDFPKVSGTNVFQISFTDSGFEGATYEENTGVYDTLEQNWVNYRLSAFANGYHFVGRCAGAPTILGTNKDNIILRSAPNAPSVFNIAKDFLSLPDRPTALVAWNGRLYAFSETRFMRINPDAMFIEEEIQGFGALSDGTTGNVGVSRLTCATPYGVFFADLNNIYQYDGQQIKTIGDPIVRNAYNGNLSWFGETNAARRRQATMVFDPNSQRVLIFFKSLSGDDTQQYYLSYDPVRERWDFGKPAGWSPVSVKASDFDSQGRLYVSLSAADWGAADTLHTMWTGDDEAITVVTPAYDFGSLRQTKWFYDVVVKNTGPGAATPSIEYRGEETASYTNPSVTAAAPLFRIDLNKLLARVLQLRVTIAAPVSGNGRNSIENITIQFRRKVMKE